jgi:hypothetical protein
MGWKPRPHPHHHLLLLLTPRWITEFLLSFDKGRETYLKPLARASLEINLLALLASGKAKLEKGWAAPEVGRVREGLRLVVAVEAGHHGGSQDVTIDGGCGVDHRSQGDAKQHYRTAVLPPKIAERAVALDKPRE